MSSSLYNNTESKCSRQQGLNKGRKVKRSRDGAARPSLSFTLSTVSSTQLLVTM